MHSAPRTGAPSGFGPNEWLVEEMYERYQADPGSVDAAWHEFFADFSPEGLAAGSGGTNGAARSTGTAAEPATAPPAAEPPAPEPPAPAEPPPPAEPAAERTESVPPPGYERQGAPAPAGDAKRAPKRPALPKRPKRPEGGGSAAGGLLGKLRGALKRGH